MQIAVGERLVHDRNPWRIRSVDLVDAASQQTPECPSHGRKSGPTCIRPQRCAISRWPWLELTPSTMASLLLLQPAPGSGSRPTSPTRLPATPAGERERLIKLVNLFFAVSDPGAPMPNTSSPCVRMPSGTFSRLRRCAATTQQPPTETTHSAICKCHNQAARIAISACLAVATGVELFNASPAGTDSASNSGASPKANAASNRTPSVNSNTVVSGRRAGIQVRPCWPGRWSPAMRTAHAKKPPASTRRRLSVSNWRNRVSASCADSEAQTEFPLTCLIARHQQQRHICASDEQYQSNQRHQKIQRPLVIGGVGCQAPSPASA